MKPSGSRAVVSCLALAAVVAQGCSLNHDPKETVVLEISGISSESDRASVTDRLGDMTDGGSSKVSSSYILGSFEVKVSPVSDVDKFAEGIDFGEVTSVEERTIKVKFTEAQGMEF